jgi:hypothetical protein
MAEKKIVGLSEDGREALALALILLRDFKAGGKFDPDLAIQIIEFANYLGVGKEYEKLQSTVPPMRVEPR